MILLVGAGRLNPRPADLRVSCSMASEEHRITNGAAFCIILASLRSRPTGRVGQGPRKTPRSVDLSDRTARLGMDFSSSAGSEPPFDGRYRSLQLNSTNPRYAGGKKRQITLVSLSRYYVVDAE